MFANAIAFQGSIAFESNDIPTVLLSCVIQWSNKMSD